MKKTLLTLFTAGIMTLSLCLSSFAGSWEKDDTGWWWKNNDGTYPVNCWQWIDGNGDGIAESYFFNASGYLLTDTMTPDNYQVDANGAWVIDGVVQTKVIAAEAPSVSESTDSASNPQPAASAGDQNSESGISASVSSQTSGNSASALSPTSKISPVPYDGYTIVVNINTKKYHRPSCSSVKSIKTKNIGYCSDSAYLDSLGYVPCKNCH